MKKKIISLLLVLLLVITGLTGCGGNEEPTSNTNGENSGNADSGSGSSKGDVKKIIYALNGEPQTLDPTMNVYARGSLVLLNMFSGLYKIDPDNSVVPALAEGYTLDDTGTVYTFKLREGLKWSDGSPLTAEDFVYSWKKILNPDTASQAAYYLYYIKNAQGYNMGEKTVDDVAIKALDDRTLEVTLENPTAYFTALTATTAYSPVKKDVVEKEGWTLQAETLVSSGPFMAKEIRPKEKLVLVKNPNYVDADKVKLDEIEMVYIESPEAELAAYENGDIDISDNISNEAMKKYVDSDEFYSMDKIGTNYYTVNCRIKPFDDPRVRKALGYSIDREAIINNIVQGTYKPAYGFIPYGIPYAPEEGKEFRDVVGNLFTEDVAEAKKLLADAGFPDGNGFPTVKLITFNSQAEKDVAQAMQGMWQQNLGINVEIETYESKVYWDELNAGNYNVGFNSWTGDYPDPMTLFESELANQNPPPASGWFTEDGAIKFNELVEATKSEKDNVKRYENFVEAEKVLMDGMSQIPLYFYNDEYLVKPYITGVGKNFTGQTIFEYADVK